MFHSFEQGPHNKGASQARECRTAAVHFLARESLLWRVTTFKSSLGAAQHSLAYRRLPDSESRIPNQVLRTAVTPNSSQPILLLH